MGTIYVARSATFSEWASDVGLSKNVFKLGYTDEPPEEVVKANWGGAEDWTIVKKKAADSLDEAEMIAKMARREKMIDPNYYPRLRGTTGIFKVPPEKVENSILVAKSMANETISKLPKAKPADFADYLIQNALK
ncbi:MAG TPA: hypothetical protein VID77_04480 [Stellaceae bacterium]|jgi:hypothetical protein